MNAIQETPLHNAARYNSTRIVQYLIENGADKSLDLVKYFIAKGSRTNVVDRSGETPLHKAVEVSAMEIIRYFIVEKGIKIGVENPTMQTLLHHSIRNDNISLFKYLLQKGASIEAEDADQKTPLHYAWLY